MSCCKGDSSSSKEYKYVGVKKEDSRNYDKRFRGPIENRSCTDVLCGILFVVFIIALIATSAWAYMFGDVRKILHPTNSQGEICGVSAAVRDKPNLVFFNLLTCAKMGPAVFIFGCPTNQICVKKCPRYLWTKNLPGEREKMICVGDKDGQSTEYKDKSIEYLMANSLCAEYVLPSIPASGRCIPDFTRVLRAVGNNSILSKENQTIVDGIGKYNKLFSVAEVSSKILNDIQNSYKYIIMGLGVTVVVSLLYLLLLRYFASFMVWMTIVLFVLLFLGGMSICFLTYYFLEKQATAIGPIDISWVATTRYNNRKFWLWMGISLSIMFVLLLLVLIFLRQRIRIAIGILVMTSKSLVYMMELLFWPLLFFVMQLIVVMACLVLIVQLSSVKNPEGVRSSLTNMNISSLNSSEMENTIRDMLDRIPCNPGDNSTAGKVCTFVKYGTRSYVYVLLGFTLFMLLWLVGFIGALGEITVAGSFASYYFALQKPRDIPSCPVFKSLYRALRYHIGSLAFGSLILAIVQFIRIIFEYLQEKASSGQNIVAVFIAKCFSCCLYCLEKFIKFLNRNAYIMIAIYGQNFCSAAKNAFNLIVRNALRVIVVDKVTDFVLFLGKLVVMGIVGGLSFLFFNRIVLKEMTPDLYYFYVPIIIIVVAAYFISSMFFSVYEIGSDTIFLCFCEDLERNDGSPEKQYFMSKELMRILHKSNKGVENFEMTA